ncbi:AAA family ATPase [Chryseobacterium sp. cx-311]|uniref:KAP family P-loop NTPase fold protein n=1 Tax=Marnyiella aurantia TaxID=2758037 RepID=UPI001AE4BF8C|nr:P-loop NTPase fold protein [Marnyiella aurantia]MBP0611593.1 AAA family ATPase [Marnyiella aurantia]
MKDIYSSDKPVTEQENDLFQRYFFSKRIAETIMRRESSDGLVIGLYGAWGEGKSTVLNFLEKELKTDDIIVVRFNPWSFSYEENILTNFYHTLATALEQKLSKNIEKIGKIFGDFGSLASVAGLDLTRFGETLSKVEPGDLKKRINKFIEDSGKKLVIIIDDIDRLDKSEIFSLIKLVKVNADFINTYYILSFDNNMVASAISDRFGDGTKQSGEHFLEKIVQVPLSLPKAQQSDLRTFTLSQIEDVINSNIVELSKDEIQNLVYFFDSAILHKIDTPRAAIRYANSISFSLPLLINEVNYVDLLLIEAVKIFYPDLYAFIREKSNFFFDSYDSTYNRNINREEIKKRFLEQIANAAHIKPDEQSNVLNLLIFLFPRLNELLNNSFNMQFGETVVREKKIGAYQYFKRYFAYTVLKGEISDISFDEFFKNLQNLERHQIVLILNQLKNDSSVDVLLAKLSAYESKLDKSHALKLVEALTVFAIDLPAENKDFLTSFMMNSKVRLAYMIKRILTKIQDENILNVYQNLISSSTNYDFAFELFRSLHANDDEKALISEKERMQLLTIIREKMLIESGDVPLFSHFDNHMSTIFEHWHNENPIKFATYIRTNVKDLESLRSFVKSIAPTITSSSRPEPYKSSINKDNYEWLTKFVDVKYINGLIKKYDSEIEKYENAFNDRFDIPTDDQRLRQLEHWYLESLKNENNSDEGNSNS